MTDSQQPQDSMIILRKFLIEYPLYHKLKYTFILRNSNLGQTLLLPSLHMYCQTCASDQTFNVYGRSDNRYQIREGVSLLEYQCVSCKDFMQVYILSFELIGNNIVGITKVGQFPPIDIGIDLELKSKLGPYVGLYKKGRICESQGYGIGAYAYYRRIVELVIDTLLDDIPNLLSDEGKKEYAIALVKTKSTQVAQEKIALVKDLLPPILRPNGVNPLSILHGTLSQGLHTGSDEECLDSASQIREVLVFLVHQISTVSSASKSFTESMRKLLERRSK